MAKEKQDYEDLTTKYELLEEDYVVIKAQGVMAKEQIESNYNALKRDHVEVENELKTLRETFNIRQDTWIKEKLDMQVSGVLMSHCQVAGCFVSENFFNVNDDGFRKELRNLVESLCALMLPLGIWRGRGLRTSLKKRRVFVSN